MTITLSDVVVPTLTRGLQTLGVLLTKGNDHAERRGFDGKTLLHARLFPDMLPLSAQVHIATDNARRGLDRLQGHDPRSMPDDPATFEALSARVERHLSLLAEVNRELIDMRRDETMSVPLGRGPARTFTGQSYALGYLIPNFLFHVTTAYGILRHNGVELGKDDFLRSFLD